MAEVRLEVDAAHPPERVWRALTDARLLREWFMATDLEPREGVRFTLDPGTLSGFLGPVTGELIEVTPPHRLVMLWQGEKLHTRVVWELTETDGGCRIAVMQSGFIGAPATLRRRALRDTYARLFAEQLPAVLDQLAAGAVPVGEAGSGSLRAAAPWSRHGANVPGANAPGTHVSGTHVSGTHVSGTHVSGTHVSGANVAVGAWSAGRTLGAGPAFDPPAGPDPDPEPAAAVAPPPVRVPRQRGTGGPDEPEPERPPSEPAPHPVAPGGEPEVAPAEARATVRATWQERLAQAPGWLRAVAIAAAAAVFAVVVLAATVHTPGEHGDAGAHPVPADEPDGPGVAIQPGAETSHTGPAGSPGPGGDPSAGPASPGPPEAAEAEGSGSPLDPSEPSDPDGDQPTTSGAPEPTPPPTLTADVSTSGLPLLGGRAVTVTVSNPGPGAASGWEVTMDVGDQEVANVDGAAYQRDGTQATFTPLSGALDGGQSAEFSFDVQAPVLGLVGASDPTDCTIDGEPCG